MKFILDENGVALPDVNIEKFVRDKVSKDEDIHTSQSLVFDWLRAVLAELPESERPHVDLVVYGNAVKMNENLDYPVEMSTDPRFSVLMDALHIIVKNRIVNRKR